jgi:hypothetical protein
MKTRVWKYWRVARLKRTLEEAKRMAPRGFKFSTTNVGEYVFRRRLIPNGLVEGPIRVTPGKSPLDDALEGKSPA